METDLDGQALLAAVVAGHPDTIWLADVDDTLIDTAGTHRSAAAAMTAALQPLVGSETALRIVERFAELFQLTIVGHQADSRTAQAQAAAAPAPHDELLARIEQCQREIHEEWGMIKKFSREVLLRLAGEDVGVPLDPEVIHYCADRYWEFLETHAPCFDDAKTLSEELARLGYPLYLMTSSDGRLELQKNGQFRYDPESSRRFKAMRIGRLATQGLHYRSVFIGDPTDKPTPGFFEMVFGEIEHDLRRQATENQVMVLGDSYRADLEYPVTRRGAALGMLYRRGQTAARIEGERVVSIGSWYAVSERLSVL